MESLKKIKKDKGIKEKNSKQNTLKSVEKVDIEKLEKEVKKNFETATEYKNQSDKFLKKLIK